MTLARIYPFFRKDRKMKLDRVKEEIANIRRTQNMFAVALMSSVGYFFTTVDAPHNLRMVISAGTSIILFFLLVIWNAKMKNNLDKLEQTGKDE